MHNPSSISLYIHFPFCRRKCRYCDFYSIPYSEKTVTAYIQALCKEWEQIKLSHTLQNARIKTIYCGGGTPSMLSVEQWQTFDEMLFSGLKLEPDCEWTIECNPDSFSENKTAAWLASGVNRLTIGVQSLNRRELRLLGRPHSAEQALSVLDNPVLYKFKSVGVDIMYGLPGQTLDSLNSTCAALFAHPVIKHISAYELTLADATPFGRHKSLLPLPSEDTTAEMTTSLLAQSRTHGFEQYEISNYSKPGFASMHNMAYWDHSTYIGLGASAHSYVHPHRWANSADVTEYIAKLADKKSPCAFSEEITLDKLTHEIIFLRLRTREGLNENLFKSMTGNVFAAAGRSIELKELLKNDLIEYKQPYWRLTDKGILMADAIARKLL